MDDVPVIVRNFSVVQVTRKTVLNIYEILLVNSFQRLVSNDKVYRIEVVVDDILGHLDEEGVLNLVYFDVVIDILNVEVIEDSNISYKVEVKGNGAVVIRLADLVIEILQDFMKNVFYYVDGIDSKNLGNVEEIIVSIRTKGVLKIEGLQVGIKEKENILEVEGKVHVWYYNVTLVKVNYGSGSVTGLAVVDFVNEICIMRRKKTG